MDSHYYTAYCQEKLLKGLPNAKIKDCERLVNWARLVKSDEEIKLMKIASEITQQGMKTAFDVINPGVRQCDAIAKIYSKNSTMQNTLQQVPRCRRKAER